MHLVYDEQPPCLLLILSVRKLDIPGTFPPPRCFLFLFSLSAVEHACIFTPELRFCVPTRLSYTQTLARYHSHSSLSPHLIFRRCFLRSDFFCVLFVFFFLPSFSLGARRERYYYRSGKGKREPGIFFEQEGRAHTHSASSRVGTDRKDMNRYPFIELSYVRARPDEQFRHGIWGAGEGGEAT